MAGRVSKYTEGRVRKICEALRHGSTRRAAVLSSGISEDTFANWLRQHSDFSDAVTRAEAECEARMAATLVQAAPEDWRAAESWLKRRRRQDWGDTLDLRKVPDDVLVRLLEGEIGAGGDPEGAGLAVGGPNGKH